MTTTTTFPTGSFEGMILVQTNKPTPRYKNLTQDAFGAHQQRMGNALATVLVEMDNTYNASFITNTANVWNKRHGTSNQPLPKLPKRPTRVLGGSKEDRETFKRELCNFMLCNKIQNQVLAYIDKVYNRKLDNAQKTWSVPPDVYPARRISAHCT